MLFAFHLTILCRSEKLVGIEEVHVVWEYVNFICKGYKALKNLAPWLARRNSKNYINDILIVSSRKPSSARFFS